MVMAGRRQGARRVCQVLSLRKTPFVDRYATAEKIAVAVDIIDPTNHGPELVLSSPWGGIGSRLSRITSIPLVCEKILSRVR